MINKLNDLKIEYYLDYDLTNSNTMKLKSKCYILIKPKNVNELKEIINISKEENMKYFILGNGSNAILPEYYDGICIKLEKLNKMTFDDGKIYVECGYMLNKLANEVSNLGYTGLEWATHIPGTIGGSIYSNAEAYKIGMSDLINNITIFKDGEVLTISKNEAKFGYRTSIFRDNKDIIILACTMNVSRGNIDGIKLLIKERLERRMSTQPLNYPSCGSVFRNPVQAPAGKLIEDAKLKGYRVGGCEVSVKHANFIINIGNATKSDYMKLIKHIEKVIKNTYNIDLILEQEIVD